MLAFMPACQTVGAIVNFVEDAGRQPISGCTRPTCVGDIRAYMGPGRLAPPPPSGMRLSAEAHGLWPSPRRVVYLGGGWGGGPAYHALSATSHLNFPDSLHCFDFNGAERPGHIVALALLGPPHHERDRYCRVPRSLPARTRATRPLGGHLSPVKLDRGMLSHTPP